MTVWNFAYGIDSISGGGCSEKKDRADGSKGNLSKNSPDKLSGRSRRNHRGTTPDGLSDKMGADDFKFTDEKVRFSVQGTQNSMNVSRNALLKQFQRDANRVSGGIEKVVKALPDEDAEDVKKDIARTESSDEELLVNADISSEEKILVAAEILEEFAENSSNSRMICLS